MHGRDSGRGCTLGGWARTPGWGPVLGAQGGGLGGAAFTGAGFRAVVTLAGGAGPRGGAERGAQRAGGDGAGTAAARAGGGGGGSAGGGGAGADTEPASSSRGDAAGTSSQVGGRGGGRGAGLLHPTRRARWALPCALLLCPSPTLLASLRGQALLPPGPAPEPFPSPRLRCLPLPPWTAPARRLPLPHATRPPPPPSGPAPRAPCPCGQASPSPAPLNPAVWVGRPAQPGPLHGEPLGPWAFLTPPLAAQPSHPHRQALLHSGDPCWWAPSPTT